MNIGAFLTFKGEILKSVLCYLIADVMWVWLSIEAYDYVGATFIGVGMTLGLAAYYKMYSGKMRNNLLW